jgi:hypothetical protein
MNLCHYHHHRHHHHHQNCQLLSTAAGGVDSSSRSVLKVFEEAWARKAAAKTSPAPDPNRHLQSPRAADPEGHKFLTLFLDCFRHFWGALKEQVAAVSVTNSGSKTVVPMEHCGEETDYALGHFPAVDRQKMVQCSQELWALILSDLNDCVLSFLQLSANLEYNLQIRLRALINAKDILQAAHDKKFGLLPAARTGALQIVAEIQANIRQTQNESQERGGSGAQFAKVADHVKQLLSAIAVQKPVLDAPVAGKEGDAAVLATAVAQGDVANDCAVVKADVQDEKVVASNWRSLTDDNDADDASERQRVLALVKGEATIVDVNTLRCAFCGKGGTPDAPLPGRDMGPHPLVNKRQERVWVHDCCAIYSAQVYFSEEENGYVNVLKEVELGRSFQCLECGDSGATIGCSVPECQGCRHYHCSLKTGWTYEEDDFSFLCPKHRSSDAAASGGGSDSDDSDVIEVAPPPAPAPNDVEVICISDGEDDEQNTPPQEPKSKNKSKSKYVPPKPKHKKAKKIASKANFPAKVPAPASSSSEAENWSCPSCRRNVFGWRSECFYCQYPRPKDNSNHRGQIPRGLSNLALSSSSTSSLNITRGYVPARQKKKVMYEAPDPSSDHVPSLGGLVPQRHPIPLSSYLPGATSRSFASRNSTTSKASSSGSRGLGGAQRPTLQQHAAWGTSSPPRPPGKKAVGSPGHKKYHPAVATVEQVHKKKAKNGNFGTTSYSISAAQKLLRASEEVKSREHGFLRSLLSIPIADLGGESPLFGMEVATRLRQFAGRSEALATPFTTDGEYHQYFEGLLLEELRYELHRSLVETQKCAARMSQYGGGGGGGRGSGKGGGHRKGGSGKGGRGAGDRHFDKGPSTDMAILSFVNEVRAARLSFHFYFL